MKIIMTCNARKLPNHIECPIDNLTYSIIDYLSELAYFFNMSPNDITTISIVFVFLAVYFLLHKKFIYFSICFIIYYILDLLDGYHARKHNKCTKFGDYYDHIRDLIIFISLSTIICFRSYKKKKWYIIIILFIFLLMSQLHMACQELHNENNIDKNHSCYSDTMSLYKCPSKKWIIITRHFGMGTLIFAVIILSYLSMK